MFHITTPTVELTDDQHTVLEAAMCHLLQFRPDQTFTRMDAGTWADCTTTAIEMVTRGYLTKPDALLTTAGLNALGLKSPEQILALNVGDTYDGMTVNNTSWTKEQGDAAEAAVGANGSMADYRKALGTPVSVLLTSDGRGHNNNGWCGCGDNATLDDTVRYERWTAQGREAHGWLHRDCRKLLQAG